MKRRMLFVAALVALLCGALHAQSQPPVIQTTSLLTGTVGVAYSQTLRAALGTPPYTWSLGEVGALPAGLTLSSSGVISGTPKAAGTGSVPIYVTDSLKSTGYKVFDWTVILPPLTITTVAALPSGTVGVVYSQSFAATGGTGPYTWSAIPEVLPPGLTLDAAGDLGGAPTQSGTFNFNVTVTDSAEVSVSKGFTVTVSAQLSITTGSLLPSGTVGVAYSLALAATGGTPPYANWRVVALALPSGLTLDAATGAISGTPLEAKKYVVQISVSDSAGKSTAKIFDLTINPAAFTITTASPLPNATAGTAYSQNLAATGGTPTYTWTAASLPSWLSLSSAGVLSGTPTQSGTFPFTVTVTDSAKATASKPFSLTVNPAVLSITTASPLPNGTMGAAYSQTLAATGGTPTYSWTAASLPSWLLLSSVGVLSGTPTQSGVFTLTVIVTDSAKPAVTASKQFTLTVAVPAAPALSVTGLTDTVSPAQQPTVDVQLSSPYSLAITGTITLTFAADAVNPSDDPSIQFSTGGRTLGFTIPAGQTSASWPSSHNIQTGTVAGTITLTPNFSAGGQNITPTPAPSRSVTIARAVPKINSVQVVKTSGGFNVLVTGYSTPRQVTQAAFSFTATSGGNLQTTQLTVLSDSAFTTWYTGTSSAAFGSSFLYTQPFTVTGDLSAISSVSVTLSNAVGSSTAVSATFPP